MTHLASMRERRRDRFFRWWLNMRLTYLLSGLSMRFISRDSRYCRLWVKNTWLTRSGQAHIAGRCFYAAMESAPITLLKRSINNPRVALSDVSDEIHHIQPATEKIIMVDITVDPETVDQALEQVNRTGESHIRLEMDFCSPLGTLHAKGYKTVRLTLHARASISAI